MLAQKRYGEKTKVGFYRHEEGGRAVPDTDAVHAIVTQSRRESGREVPGASAEN
jgi:hypothetical protein